MKTKGIALGAFIAMLLGGVIFFGYNYFKPKPNPGISGLESILLKRELHLVEYKYNNHFFIHNKPNKTSKLALIIRLPVKVSSFVNLEGLKIDSVQKKILLPYPEIGDIMIDIANEKEREIMKIRDGFLIKIRKSKSKLFESFFTTIDMKSKELEADAIKKGILKQAKNEATSFVNDLLTYFDKQQQYRVEFFNSDLDTITSTDNESILDLKNEPKFETNSEIDLIENEGFEWNYIQVEDSIIENLFEELEKENN